VCELHPLLVSNLSTTLISFHNSPTAFVNNSCSFIAVFLNLTILPVKVILHVFIITKTKK